MILKRNSSQAESSGENPVLLSRSNFLDFPMILSHVFTISVREA